ncbi:DUF3280 domain-containing protein [Acidiphilium sp. AL]|uniref:DUF3280 domain-containing protein n=1 Tax=Acidiphilium iwatense TaxID=768198 RepID=A0ABS9DYQ9_9PROT|nr:MULTISPECIES: DUF2380 domain-containing protein [Acidiphilium]MCF3947888.1 DUF3280 domain-containing protein [Acidiphilium iwatense]MCU4161434.1 DUF3280 domain-containing protein [Acidiphilium sp. AL]
MSFAGVAESAPPEPPYRPGMVIEAFDLFDTSIDHRPMVVAAQKRWLADAAARLRERLDAGKQVSVIDSAATTRMTASIAHSYQHPSTCRRCILAEAHKLGARYVFIGSVHKVSDLIIYMDGELDRVGDHKPLMVRSMEVKADDKTMILRAADTMVAAIERHLG